MVVVNMRNDGGGRTMESFLGSEQQPASGTGGGGLSHEAEIIAKLLNLTVSYMFNLTENNDTLWQLQNNGTLEDEEGAFGAEALPWWRQLFWSILFGTIVVVATVGNLIVIWIVLAHKRMRTVTNYLLVNLSIADAMVSTLNVIPNYVYMLSGHWPFGLLYCKLVQFVAVLSICASVFSLMAIAFDRYMAIMNPLRPRMGKRLTLGIAAGIWVGGCALSMPMILYFTTFERVTEDSSTIICYAEWPDGPQTESYSEYLYNVLFMVFTYFVPIIAMGFTYARVGLELWGSKSIGECTQRQLENIKSKRRVVKMMIVVVTLFACCWLPYHMYFIVVSLWPQVTTLPFVQEVFLAIYWLAMSNSMYNPIIYCWMNARFRRGFQQVFSWCPFVHYNDIDGPTTHVMGDGVRREPTTRYSVTGSPEMHTRIARNGSAAAVHIPLHVLTNHSENTNTGNLLHVNNSGNSGAGSNSLSNNSLLKPYNPKHNYHHRHYHSQYHTKNL